MELSTLKCLVSLAELGSVTAAAEAHYLTQPALSIRIRKLQEELGVTLVETRGRSARFTRAGEIVLEYARRFGRLEEELGREIADLAGLVRGRIAIGTIDAASAYVLPRVFSRFRERYPGIDISLEVTATNPLLAALRAGRLDLVVGTLPVERGSDLDVFPVYRERLLLIAPPGHPLARVRAPAPSALVPYPFISFHEGAITRRIIEEALRKNGVVPHVTTETDSPEAIRNLVAAGLGLAILPERLVREDVKRGAVVELRIPGLLFERHLGLILPSSGYLSSTVRAFLGVLARGLDVKLPERYLPDAAHARKLEGRSKRNSTRRRGERE